MRKTSIPGARVVAKPDDWLRLWSTAANARNDLSDLGLELTAAVERGCVSAELIVKARDVVMHHASELRAALKHPAGIPSRRYRGKIDPPCWSDTDASKDPAA